MPTEISPLRDGAPPTPPAIPTPHLMASFFAGLSPKTVTAYASDLEDFARFLEGPGGPAEAVRRLTLASPGDANGLALGYRNSLLGRGLATATVARRLAALRS